MMLVEKAKEVESLLEQFKAEAWLVDVKAAVLEDYRQVRKAIENLATCNVDFQPLDKADPLHLTRVR